ncbi:glycosyltransferase family 4 protein [Maribacter flavus]|uniref:Glycosyltransferase family 4 protein n=1 Tax=Maribacter flavus TaxID=1658664 RepID=A0A5B2TUT0_9FLAO|nr:glycosyltransferase family 4 protein [Maribacter flavus]KAA2217460.1 glycosyltransferase family 4 protein [Maribacter flavus]
MKKNIGFVINSLNSGGAERVVVTLANGLSELYNIFIFTLVDIDPFYKINEKVIYDYCTKSIRPSSNPFQALNNNIFFYRKLNKLVDSNKIDLLIGFTTNINVLTILCARKFGIPVIVSERNNPEKIYIPRMWKILTKITYPKADFLVVQTEPIRKFFEKNIKKENIVILPNPLSKNHFQIKNNFNGKKENVVLNVGRLTEQKGQEILIKAFASINPKNWQLHIIGEGHKRNEYQELIETLGMQGKIKLLGRIKEISEYYLRSKIFVFPSRYEGFPNALTEAMYMGLPCISTDCPTGPSELIKNNENGILIPIDEIEELKVNLKRLINDEELRLKLGREASKSVLHLEEESVIADWNELIKQF